MSGTLLTIVVLLAVATAVAILQAQRRDRCLEGFEGFHVTLAEHNGTLAWGRLDVYASGLEVTYDTPVPARAGHLEGSSIFYNEQYEAMDALYRVPEGLPPEEQQRRAEAIRRTARPSAGRRLLRRMRNWAGMVRDALIRSAGLLVGMAGRSRRGAAVLASQEQNLAALSGEVVGHAGNAFDPLLEAHIYRQVVVEVTRAGVTRSYCGWLKDYTSQFVEVVDAYANAAGVHVPRRWYAPDAAPEENASGEGASVEDASGEGAAGEHVRPAPFRIEAFADHVRVVNETEYVLSVHQVEAGEDVWAIGCVLPPGSAAALPLPEGADAGAAHVQVSTAERIDLVVPRARAIVRHAADGTEANLHAAPPSVVADALRQNAPAHDAPAAAPARAPQDAPSKPTPSKPAPSQHAAST